MTIEEDEPNRAYLASVSPDLYMDNEKEPEVKPYQGTKAPFPNTYGDLEKQLKLCTNYGVRLFCGDERIEQNQDMAINYFRQAAESGFPLARYNLAFSLLRYPSENNQMVVNHRKARELLIDAEIQGFWPATILLDTLETAPRQKKPDNSFKFFTLF